MTLRTSNSVFLAVLDPLPRENLGWWAEVYDAHNPNTLLTKVYRFEELAFLDPRSDVGVGTVKLADDDPIFTDALPNALPLSKLLSEPAWWRVMDNGVERFRWLYEGRAVPRDDEEPVRVLNGRGRAVELEFATVLPAQWPTQTKAISRKYVQRTWAYVFLELLAEAKARGAISTDVRATFTAAVDSKGMAWTDLADYEVPVGGDLLSLLQQWKESAGFEWHMTPSGYLDAATDLGFNRTGTVRFYEGINVITAEDMEDASALRNDIYGQAADGTIARAFSPTSIAKYRRRETFINSGTLGDISATNLTVNGSLRLLQEPVTSKTFKVPLEVVNEDGEDIGRRVYVDYAVADSIGLGARLGDGSNDVKVVSIAIKVTSEGPDLEVTVQSKREQLIAKLTRLLQRQLGGSFSPSASGGTLTGVIKQVISGNTDLGELTDVDVAGAVDGAYLRYNALAGQWVDGPAEIGDLDDLNDVDTTGVADGDSIVYDTGEWVARARPTRHYVHTLASLSSGTMPVSPTLIPGMTVTIPSATEVRTAFIDAMVVWTGAHTNQVTIYVDGTAVTYPILGNVAGSVTTYDAGVSGIPVELAAGSSHTIEVRWRSADSTAAVTLVQRTLSVEVVT